MLRIRNLWKKIQTFIAQISSSPSAGPKPSSTILTKKDFAKIRNFNISKEIEIKKDTFVTVPIGIYASNLPIFFGLLDQVGVEFTIDDELLALIDLMSEEIPEYYN
jgi:hypothetical protein